MYLSMRDPGEPLCCRNVCNASSESQVHSTCSTMATFVTHYMLGYHMCATLFDTNGKRTLRLANFSSSPCASPLTDPEGLFMTQPTSPRF